MCAAVAAGVVPGANRFFRGVLQCVVVLYALVEALVEDCSVMAA